MIPILTTDEVRAAERAVMTTLPPGTLMERAASAIAVECFGIFRQHGGIVGRQVLLLVGAGDNGGDALFAGVRLLRVNYVGELGWELHVPMAEMPKVFDALMAAGKPHGIRLFGTYAMNALRIEKAYRGWGSELTTEIDMIEASMERFLRLDKEDFIGKAATLRRKVIMVDDFPKDFGRSEMTQTTQPVTFEALRKTA